MSKTGAVDAALPTALASRAMADAVEQQTATAEILRVISRSPGDAQPVFDTIAAAALKLCHARSANVLTYDGTLIRIVAIAVVDAQSDAAIRSIFPQPAGRGTAASRAVLSCNVAAIPDVLVDTDYVNGVAAETAGFRSILAVPLMRQGKPIGVVAVGRAEPGPFSVSHVTLLQTFAEQAVIAIENARLFREIEDKGRQLEIASQHKSAFLANMSHELRTPLNAIIGFTRLVMRRSQERLEPKQFENLEKILASGQHLLALINAVLDLARVEAGHVEVVVADVVLAPLLDECLRTVEPLLAADVTSASTCDAGLSPMRVDKEKLRQIVINLLSNAAKFTVQGWIELRAQARGDDVSIAVADTGIGIPADKLELIFEEFEQVDASATRAHGGTGLGLAIARRLARLMGGDLHAESILGAGSTFTLTLPLRYRGPAA